MDTPSKIIKNTNSYKSQNTLVILNAFKVLQKQYKKIQSNNKASKQDIKKKLSYLEAQSKLIHIITNTKEFIRFAENNDSKIIAKKFIDTKLHIHTLIQDYNLILNNKDQISLKKQESDTLLLNKDLDLLETFENSVETVSHKPLISKKIGKNSILKAAIVFVSLVIPTFANYNNYNNDLELLKSFVQNKRTDVNLISQGETLLIKAIRLKQFDIAKILISRDADLNLPDQDGTTPLIKTIRIDPNNFEFIDYLLSKGADINKEVNPGTNGSFTALDVAIALKEFKLAEHLVSRRAKLNYIHNGLSQLQWALWNNQPWLAMLMITHGANVNQKYEDGTHIKYENQNYDVTQIYEGPNTILMVAASKGYLNVVKEIISMKVVNINEKDKNGMSALDYASKNKHKKVVKILKAAGAK